MSVDASGINTNLSILDLPNIITLLYQRADPRNQISLRVIQLPRVRLVQHHSLTQGENLEVQPAGREEAADELHLLLIDRLHKHLAL